MIFSRSSLFYVHIISPSVPLDGQQPSKTVKLAVGISKEDFRSLKEDLIFLQHCLKTVLQDYKSYFEERFVAGLSIRKYAQAHSLNRGSVDYLQKKFFTALAHELKERDEAQGKKRIRTI